MLLTKHPQLLKIDTTRPIRVHWVHVDMVVKIFTRQKRMQLAVSILNQDDMQPKLVEEEHPLPPTSGSELRLAVEHMIVWFLWRNRLTKWMPDETWAHCRMMEHARGHVQRPWSLPSTILAEA